MAKPLLILLIAVIYTTQLCTCMPSPDSIRRGPELEKHNRQKRKALDFNSPTFSNSKWTLPIRYAIAPNNYTAEEEQVIVRAFKIWEERTCLRFENVTSGYAGEHIEIRQGPRFTLCVSDFGKTTHISNPQIIFLNPFCLLRIGGPLTYIAHAMGLIPETARQDRDDFVQINIENVQPLRVSFFDKINDTTSLGLPYDYASLLQYRSEFLHFNGHYTNLPTPEHREHIHSMGHNADLSFLDVTAMNRLYQCWTDNAPAPTCNCDTSCQNNGYPDPGSLSNCTSCRCPAGLKGDCTEADDGSTGCSPLSGNIAVTSTTESCLTSPNYGNTTYNNGDRCSWLLKAPAGGKILLWFEISEPFGVFNSFGGFLTRTCHHWVEIKYNGNLTENGKRFCGSSTLEAVNMRDSIKSEREEVVIDFRSDYPDNDPRRMAGFKLCYKLYKEGKGSVKPSPKQRETPCLPTKRSHGKGHKKGHSHSHSKGPSKSHKSHGRRHLRPPPAIKQLWGRRVL